MADRLNQYRKDLLKINQNILELIQKRKEIIKQLTPLKKTAWDPVREIIVFSDFLKTSKNCSVQEALVFSLIIEEQAAQNTDYPLWSRQEHLSSKQVEAFAMMNPILLKMHFKQEYSTLNLKEEFKRQIEELSFE